MFINAKNNMVDAKKRQNFLKFSTECARLVLGIIKTSLKSKLFFILRHVLMTDRPVE